MGDNSGRSWNFIYAYAFVPLLLLTSPDYGLTFCFTTPVFLYLLILFYSKVNLFAYRIKSFNGLLYALFNLTNWLNPSSRWMGVLHIPLLMLSTYALIQSKLPKYSKVTKLSGWGMYHFLINFPSESFLPCASPQKVYWPERSFTVIRRHSLHLKIQ